MNYTINLFSSSSFAVLAAALFCSCGANEGHTPQPRSVLELPDDLRQPAVAWIEAGRPPTPASLSTEDLKRLHAWLEKKLKVAKPNEVLVIYKDIRHYKTERKKVHVFQPPGFKGKAVRGGPRSPLTDGRLTLTVTGAEKRPYTGAIGHRAQPRFPYEYAVTYALENRGAETLKVSHFESLFFEPSGVLAVGWKTRNLKRDGTKYTDTDEPFAYEPKSKKENVMRSRGACQRLNNICLRVSYSDGSQTLFAVYIPPKEIVDKTRREP